MKRKITMASLLLLVIFFCSACGMAQADRLTTEESGQPSAAANAANQPEQGEEQSTADLPKMKKDGTFQMILKHDIQNYQITFMDITTGEQVCYEYTDGTEFFDKYGNYTLREDFSEGKLAVIERLNSNDTLGAIAFTDQTWDYEDVSNYVITAEKSRMDIADTAYQFAENAKAFSEGEEKELYTIGENDILNVYGIDRTIYAVVVTTGHGTLALTNTELFEGGWVNLGTKVYAKITKDLTLELPEGVYDFSVANDGYGDSGEVRIRRDLVTTIDLNDYKGEGPKMCKVTFDVGVAGAILTVNGKEVNHKKPLELRYGVYKLGVYAQGYDPWTRQLVINSPKAKIEILLTNDTQAQEGTETKEDEKYEADRSEPSTSGTKRGKAGTKAGTRAGSYTDGNSSSESNDSNSADSALANAALGSSLANIITGGESTDYLDTLSDLVDSLDRLDRSRNRSNESENAGD